VTTSGTYDIGNEEQIDIVTEMFERIGRPPSSLSSNDIDSARRSLSYLFSDWSNDQVNLWKVELQSTALTALQSSITLTARQVAVLQAYTRTTEGGINTDLVISPISRAEYAAIPNKAQTSTRPTQYYLERTIVPTLYLWPLPLATGVTLRYYSVLMSQSPGDFVDTMDAPNRWMEAIAAGGAMKLAQKFAPERLIYLEPAYGAAYARAKAEDRERVPLRITVDMTGYSL
jgi:hypothetical protein